MRSGRAILVVVVALVTATVSGCASDSKSPIKPTASVSIAAALSPANFGEVVGAAVLKAGTTHAELTADAGSQRFTAGADLVIRVAGNLVAGTVDLGSPKPVEVRLIDTVLYVNLGKATNNTFVGVPYPPTKKFKSVAPYARIINQLDPAALIRQFAAAPESVEQSLDPVTVDGVVARSFVLKVGTGAKAASITAYVGPDNLPRRVTVESGGGKVIIDYTQWGSEIAVTKPSPDELAGQD